MKIALVLADTPAYSETFFNTKIKGLLQQGFRVTLYTRNQSKPFDLCPVICAPDFSGNTFYKILAALKGMMMLVLHLNVVLKFVKLEKESRRPPATIVKNLFLNSHFFASKAQWVHFGFSTLAIGSENVAAAIGAKMAVSFRGFDINVYPLKNPGCYSLVWKKVDKVHSISDYLWQKALTIGLSKEVPKEIITPAVVLESLPGIAAELYPSKIVTVARFNWIKGLDNALKAIRKLKLEGLEPEYHIVGGGNREEEELVKFLAHIFEIEEQVVFHGRCSHDRTLQIVKDAKVYLQPSLNEGFCNAVLEAQALGIPCVVTNGGALPENVLSGKTGWLVPVFDNQKLSDALKTALTITGADLQKMRDEGIKMVKTRYAITKQIDKFREFYTNK